MHIAVLMTNTDESDFAKAHPKDGEKFRTLLRGLRPNWQVSVFSVKDGAFPAESDRFDGYLITGSPASVHDLEPWIGQLDKLIRKIVAEGTPLFGACFGHQAIARAMGGEVAENPGGWVLGLAETEMEGHKIRLYAAHLEQVFSLPPGAVALGGNADCPIGSFAVGHTVLTTQYHPEMSDSFIAALTDELDGKLPAAVISNARLSLSQRADNAWIARRIVRFFEGG